MPRRIRARDVAGLLADRGHEASEFDGGDWDPGYRVVQRGPRLVHVLHDGPGETERLGDYTDDLRLSGCVVVTEQPADIPRRRLAVTRP